MTAIAGRTTRLPILGAIRRVIAALGGGPTVRSAAAAFGPTFATRHAAAIATLSDLDLIAMTTEELVRYVRAYEARIARKVVRV